ncbi:MAG TPA: hypothetical protein VNJ09_05845 [Chthonomonadales bacterium]|nr:hypothetical protein [Chthonomonadales bacterium]
MSSLVRHFRKVLAATGLAGLFIVTTAAPSRCDGPMVPAPKLPPPSCIIAPDDVALLYPDGTIVYSDGTYVRPDGTIGLL